MGLSGSKTQECRNIVHTFSGSVMTPEWRRNR